jgi:hypothetical protein
MTFQVGHKYGGKGGRPKGSKNKINRSVADQLQDLPWNCNPFEGLARIAKKAEEQDPPALHIARSAYSTLAEYIAPKQRSAVEVENLEQLVISWQSPPEKKSIIHVDAIEDE